MIDILSAICPQEDVEMLSDQIFSGCSLVATLIVLSETQEIATIILVR